jgi:hypothetical protein
LGKLVFDERLEKPAEGGRLEKLVFDERLEKLSFVFDERQQLGPI